MVEWGGKTSFIHPLYPEQNISVDPKLCQSQTTSVKVNTNRNLVHLTQKNSCFDLSLTAPTLGAKSFIGVKKIVFHIQRFVLT